MALELERQHVEPRLLREVRDDVEALQARARLSGGRRAAHIVSRLRGVPDVSLEREEDPGVLVRIRNVQPDGTASYAPGFDRANGTGWAELWPGPEHAIFGHDALRRLQRHLLQGLQLSLLFELA